MTSFTITLHFDTGASIMTNDDTEGDPNEIHEDVQDYLNDTDTGNWKQIGHVSFYWKRLIGFEIRADRDLPRNCDV